MPEDDDLNDENEDVQDDQHDEDTDDSGDEDKGSSKGDDPAAKARREAANLRKRLRAAEASKDQATKDAVQKVLKALGVDDGDDVDPEKLRQQSKAQADKLRQRTVELAVVRSATKHGGDPDALMDSRSFLEGLADLDPDDDDFQAQVADAIKSAVKKNPRLSGKAQVAGSSGGAHGSGSGTGSGSNKDDGKEESPEDAYAAVLKRRTKRQHRS